MNVAWFFAASGVDRTISGLALLSETATKRVYLALHDNDFADTPRLSLLTVVGNNVTTELLSWPAPQPVDMEALFKSGGKFFAVTSAGRILRFTLSGSDVVVDGDVDIPGATGVHQIEGADVCVLNGITFIVWARRGSTGVPSIIAWRPFDPVALTFSGSTQTFSFSTPFPTTNVRHVSALRVEASGSLIVSSASDPGDNGPFSSAVYRLGNFEFLGGAIVYAPASPQQLYSTTHKIEAIGRTPGEPGGLVVGADDENFGGWIGFEVGQVYPTAAAAQRRADGDPLCGYRCPPYWIATATYVAECPPGSTHPMNVSISRTARSEHSYEHALQEAQRLAKLEAEAELACFSATACVTPDCGGLSAFP